MKIIEKNPSDPESIRLMDELSKELEFITGDSGRNSFNPENVCVPRSLFVVAYDDNGEVVGCGGIRYINKDIAEVKRMFSKIKTMGVGSEILSYLELQAKKIGYSVIWLETRLINKQAVNFYKKRGYHQIQNYGKYNGNSKAICFEKKIV